MKRLVEFAAMVFITTFAVVIFIEWLAGCGESYVDAYGVRHVGQCVFVR